MQAGCCQLLGEPPGDERECWISTTLQLKTSLKILYLQAALDVLPAGEVAGFVDWAGDAVSAPEEALSTSQSHKENL